VGVKPITIVAAVVGGAVVVAVTTVVVGLGAVVAKGVAVVDVDVDVDVVASVVAVVEVAVEAGGVVAAELCGAWWGIETAARLLAGAPTAASVWASCVTGPLAWLAEVKLIAYRIGGLEPTPMSPETWVPLMAWGVV